MSASDSKPLRLNVGSGPQVIPGWTSIDKSWAPVLGEHPQVKRILIALRILDQAQAEIRWPPGILRLDVVKQMPWASGSVDAIYSSHFVEHLKREEASRFFRESARVLRPGGILRLAMPDLRRGAEEYLEGSRQGDPDAGDAFIEFLYFNPSHSGSALRRMALKLVHRPHGWMYDVPSLSEKLVAAGFERPLQYGLREGECPNVEQLDTRPESFFLEARTPKRHHTA